MPTVRADVRRRVTWDHSAFTDPNTPSFRNTRREASPQTPTERSTSGTTRPSHATCCHARLTASVCGGNFPATPESLTGRSPSMKESPFRPVRHLGVERTAEGFAISCRSSLKVVASHLAGDCCPASSPLRAPHRLGRRLAKSFRKKTSG